MNRSYSFLLALLVPSSLFAMTRNSFILRTLENKTAYNIDISGFGFSELLGAYEKKQINVSLTLLKNQPRWESQELLVIAKQAQKIIKLMIEIDHGLNEFDNYHNDFVVIKKILPSTKRFFKDAPTIAAWSRRNYLLLAPQNYVIDILFKGDELEKTRLTVKEQPLVIYPEENKKTMHGLEL
jgi:hypothetical protein